MNFSLTYIHRPHVAIRKYRFENYWFIFSNVINYGEFSMNGFEKLFIWKIFSYEINFMWNTLCLCWESANIYTPQVAPILLKKHQTIFFRYCYFEFHRHNCFNFLPTGVKHYLGKFYQWHLKQHWIHFSFWNILI